MKDSSKKPLVSVIIPVFNAERYVRQTLESVLSQSYDNIEVIVVDDGSTDESGGIVREFGSRIRYHYQRNSGACSSPRNAGFRLSSGSLVTFFDSDDIMTETKIEEQVNCLLDLPGIKVTMTDYVNFNEHGDYEKSHFATCRVLQHWMAGHGPLKGDVYVIKPEEARLILSQENFSISNSLLARREVLDEIGVYDEDLRASEDFDLTYRIAMRYEIALVNRVGFRRRLHETNMSHNASNILREKIRSREKALAAETNKAVRKNIKAFIGEAYLGMAEGYIRRDKLKSLRSIARAFKARPFHTPVARKLAKLILSVSSSH